VIIDSHLHVWDLERSPYSWIDRNVPPFNRTFTFDEVAPQLEQNGVDAVILVQADDDDRDTHHMLEVAAARPEVVGVVAYVPLESPAEAEVRLEELLTDPYVVGIRNLTHDRADPDWVLRPDVDETLGLLEQEGVPWDYVSVLPRHLEHVATISERHPDLRIVIDHLAKPPIGEASREPWWSLIEVAARNPLVHAKISGLYPGAEPASWTVEGLRPFVDRSLAVFGPQRLMYGGDWPISVAAGGYRPVLRGLRQVLGELSADEADSVWSGTARRIYGVDHVRPQALGREQAERPGDQGACPPCP
jgi:L-fuconolactonase